MGVGSHRQSILYDAWGNERERVGVSANKFTFTGHELDEETGLIYAKARFYDPDVGRFLTQDSFLGDVSNVPSLHRYLYAAANPTRFFDPTGHAYTEEQKKQIFFGIAKGSGVVGRTADEVAAPILPRAEGLLSFVVPGGVSYWKGERDDASYTRRFQRGVLNEARNPANSGLTRFFSGVGAVLLQPGAVLNDIAHALTNVPGQLKAAGGDIGEAIEAESLIGAAYELTEAVEKTAGATEVVVGTVVLVRASAKARVIEESRSTSQTKTAPAKTTTPQQQVEGPLQGSGGTGKVYEIPASELKSGKPYIGKTKRPVPRRMADKDHKQKTPSGKPPKADVVAENLSPSETAGVEAILIEETGLENLTNVIPGLNPTLPKNAARLEAGRRVLQQRK